MKDYLLTLASYIRRKDKRYLINVARGLKGKKGIEIGGPSGFFRAGGMPVYLFATQVDGVNFSNDTVWEGSIKKGNTYKYTEGKIGYQYIAEATGLSEIPDASYDFLLSCHSLEHVANPLKAINGWKRVLKKGGTLVLVLPDKENTFDDKRPYTNFEHLLKDLDNNVDEKDTTHFDEILSLHDYGRDNGITTMEDFKTRLLNNYTYRCAHHHVFSNELVKKMLGYCGFSVLHQQKLPPFHLITIANKE